MDDSPKPPLHFANRLVAQLINHLVGEDVVVLPEDYTAIRTAFRAAGGSWEAIHVGSLPHTLLLEKLVKSWGKLPNRVHTTEMH